ncbi:MAG: hypothetical protein J07HQW2_00440 [Haloquadratum walsbyi J07HQW2]|uniref:Uncharacterized protein n=1 Tax=Haloquadratum walsbyi J07HQW2 TaxID=1238425 RepID=U1PNZ5_9EURY|nr:MAG: hypothetical protein J07HQW2_00440 [Haloquadratum walsbyi J07HQW2]
MRRRRSYRYRTKVNACCLVPGCSGSGCLDFHFVCADEMQFPASFRFVVDSPELLQILNRNTGASFVFDNDKDVLPRFGMFLFSCDSRPWTGGHGCSWYRDGCHSASTSPDRTARMFLVIVNTIAVVVGVVLLAVAGRIRSTVTVRVSLAVPRHEFELKASASSSRTR